MSEKDAKDALDSTKESPVKDETPAKDAKEPNTLDSKESAVKVAESDITPLKKKLKSKKNKKIRIGNIKSNGDNKTDSTSSSDASSNKSDTDESAPRTSSNNDKSDKQAKSESPKRVEPKQYYRPVCYRWH